MLNLFFEGIQSALLPCSAVILIPGVLIVLAGRDKKYPAMAAFIIGASIFSWLELSEQQSYLNNVSAGLLFAVSAIVAFPRKSDKDLRVTSVVSGITAGIASVSLWVPCTGEHYGDLQETIDENNIGGLFHQLSYLLGITIPLIAVAAIFLLIKPKIYKRIVKPLTYFASATLMIFAILVVAGAHETMISNLTKWSI